MNTPIVGYIYHVVDKTTNQVIKVGSTIRTLQQRFAQADYKTKYTNHFIREYKTIQSSELDWYDPQDPYCPFSWHLVAAEHMEILRAGTFQINDLSNYFSPLDQKFFNKFGATFLAVAGGKKGGRAGVLSGHLKSISSLGGKAGGAENGRKNGSKLVREKKGLFKPGQQSQAGKIGGPICGRIAVESGQLASIRTPEHQSMASKHANHNRWHVNRGITNPKCQLCQEAQNVLVNKPQLQTDRTTLETTPQQKGHEGKH